MTEQRKALIIGYRQGMIDACHQIGIQCINIVDAWDEPETLPPCKEGEVRIVNTNNAKNEHILLTLARKGMLEFDTVCTADESFVVSAALLSKTLSNPHMDPKVSIAFRDKYYQKELLRGTVPVANSWLIEDVRQYNDALQTYSYPVVLKPVSAAAASHTYIVNDQSQLNQLIENHKYKAELPKSMVIEQYISGEELHIDGWITDGELQLFSISKYGMPCIEIKNGWVSNSVTLRPELHQKIYSRLRSFVTKTLNKLGLANGVFHMELFYDSSADEFIFGECGARVGGPPIPDAFRYMFGIDLHEVLIRLALGEKVKMPNFKTSNYVGWTDLPSVPDNTNELPDKAELMMLPGVVQVQYTWSPGQDIPDTCENTLSRTGMALVVGDNEQQVRERILNLTNCFTRLSNEHVEA